jgi:UDP-glucose 4-epimerase
VRWDVLKRKSKSIRQDLPNAKQFASRTAVKMGVVLVTGGAGFIGANLIRNLLAGGYKVAVLDDLSTGRRTHLLGLPVILIEASVLDPQAVAKAASGCAAIVHLAAQTGVTGSLLDPRHDCELNVLGTLNLLEAARHARIKRFVFASSNAVLGRQKPPAAEDKAPLPLSPYGASKLAAEGYCVAYHGSWGLDTVALRFANVYGPFCEDKGSVVAKFFKDFIARGEITIEGDGGQTRDFIFVVDLCQAIMAALQSGPGGEVFQIATGVETSITRLAGLVQETVGGELGIRRAVARQGDIRVNVSKIDKAGAVLGWQPEYDLREGLRKTWHWLRATKQ